VNPRYAFTYFLRHPTILHNILCQMVALDKFECPIRTGTIRVVTSSVLSCTFAILFCLRAIAVRPQQFLVRRTCGARACL
jgi:hypothetical protein